jgi:N-acetylneuraminate synthase/N,N'-diacetyllegionaminate synthase
MKIIIGGKQIGDGEPCFIIAEAGSNHNRDFKLALGLIDAAVEANVDAVKFQTYSAETLYSRETPIFPGESTPPYEVVKKYEIPRNWQPELASYAQKKGIIFLSSPFDYKAVNELAAVGIQAYKIASSEINDLPFLKYIASQGKPIILSTGMCHLADIQLAVKAIKEVGNQDIILLQCTAVYPTNVEEINLRAMDTLKNAFHLPVGFSDHSLGIFVPIAAVARGATIVEKHFTLSRKFKGPDHSFALEPHELRKMVTAIREVERSLGSPIKEPTAGEQKKMMLSRRSIISAKDISKGTIISGEMLIIKRPALGISPEYLEIVIGRRAKKNIKKDEPITWDKI